MTSCNDIREDLVAFLDGELPRARAEVVREHLADCSACQAESAALSSVWVALDHLPGLEPRAGWLAEVEASIVSPKVVPFPLWRRGLATVAVAAAVALAVGLGWLLSQPAEVAPSNQLVVTEPAPRVLPADPPQVHELPPRERPEDDEPSEEPDDRGPDDPGAKPDRPEQPALPAEDPALAMLEDLTDEELDMIEDLDVVAVLDELDELDVLENLDLLEDLDDEELPDDA